MKLKTKFQDEDFELGEVVEVYIATGADGSFTLRANADKGGLNTFYYKSLSTLNEMWEDCKEEPKGYWYIDADGDILLEPSDDRCEFDNNCREIGNYFETEEEAERAVEKLKAWQRLKNNGFRFDGEEVFSEGLIEIDGVLPALKGADAKERLKMLDDLNICFGGKE